MTEPYTSQWYAEAEDLAAVLCVQDLFRRNKIPCQACNVKAEAAMLAGWRYQGGEHGIRHQDSAPTAT